MMLPPLFIQRIRQTFPTEEAEALLAAIADQPAISVRLHSFKKSDNFKHSSNVPWNEQGKYLLQRPEFIFDPDFHAGAYYVQESSSMFLKKALGKVNLPSRAIVLDLCAAPGGKSTLLLSEIPSDALLVANEVIRTRIPALKENIQRWGYPNAMVTNSDPQDFESLPETFDLVLIDAPCSGEGMFRKDPEAVKHWNPENLQTCELRQERILKSAVHIVKTGGYLIYSTCTFNPRENEKQLEHLLENGFECISILSQYEFPEIKRVPICDRGEGYAFYPHKVKGEGFFLALLKKTNSAPTNPSDSKTRKPFFEKSAKNVSTLDSWMQSADFIYKERNGIIYAIPQVLEKNMQLVSQSVQTMYMGIAAGEMKGNEFIPDHALALSNIVKKEIPYIDFTEEEALRYLKKESNRNHDLPKGIYAVRYNGLNLGWVKAVPGRLNNLLPMEFRIRKNIEW